MALSWSHYQAVAALDPVEADEWLDKAEAKRWNVAELRGMVHTPRRLGTVIADEARRAVEDRERIEEAARAVPRAVSPAESPLYMLVPAVAIEALREALGGRA